MVGESFEVLQALAATDVKELVVVTETADPEAPAGETMTGAPLRLRPDWGERQNSKDLIVDPDCEADPSEVRRILKKKGLYLSSASGPEGLELPHQAQLESQTFSGFAAALGPWPENIELKFSGTSDAKGPALFLGSLSPLPQLSGACLGTAEGITSPDAKKQIRSLEAKLKRRDQALEKSKASEKALRRDFDALRAEMKTIKIELTQARTDLSTESEKRKAAENAHGELEDEFETVREELRSRRITDRRSDLLEARYARARDDMNVELQNLRTQVREMADTYMEYEQACSERDATISQFRKFLERIAQMLESLTPKGALPETPVPGPSEAQAKLLEVWLDVALKVVAKSSKRTTDQNKTLRSMRGKVANMTRRIKVLEASQTNSAEPILGQQAGANVEIPPLPSKTTSEQKTRIKNLEKALDAERKLRAADEKRLTEFAAIAEAGQRDRNALMEALQEAESVAKDRLIQSFVLEEDHQRSQAEIAEREVRLNELEQMLATHRQIQSLMTDAARAAEDGRAEAEIARRMADENLRIMKAEFDRAQGAATSEL